MLAMLIEEGTLDPGFAAGFGQSVDETAYAHLLTGAAVYGFADRETWLSASGQGTKAASALVAGERIDSMAAGLGVDNKVDPRRFVPPPKNRHESPATTAFSAADAYGNAVSCAVSMNSSFGTGRVAKGSGVLLAAAPGFGGRGPVALAPITSSASCANC